MLISFRQAVVAAQVSTGAQSPRAIAAVLGLTVLGLLSTGCVRRVVSITSDPSGAMVSLNDREIGRTPCQAEFTYYGTYDVRLEKEGFEPLSTSADANAPWWDNMGPDVVAEAVPADLKSLNEWHFTLIPVLQDRAALVDRAKELRDRTAVLTPQPVPELAPTTTPEPAHKPD